MISQIHGSNVSYLFLRLIKFTQLAIMLVTIVFSSKFKFRNSFKELWFSTSSDSKALTSDIKVLRSQIKSLDYIRKRSSKYREYNKQLEQKRYLDKQRA